MKRCSLCVLPETYPGITFDPQGRCTFCLDYSPIQVKGERAFQDTFCRPSKAGEYGFLVPLSGGRDSSYVLYQMVRHYGYRVAAYNYDNMFVDPMAVANIKRLTDSLGVPLVRLKSRVHCLTRRSFLKVNLQRTPLHFLYCLCYGCPRGIWGGAWRVARNLGVDYIVKGESYEENAEYKKLHQAMLCTSIREKLSMAMRKPVSYLNGKCLQVFFTKRFPCNEAPSPQETGFVNFFDYHAYNEEEIINVLEKEIGWKSNEHTNWRFDCELHSLILQITYQILGMTEWDDMYSKLVRKGEISRQEALHRVEKFEGYRELLRPRSEEILMKLGLNSKERRKVLLFLDGPPRLRNVW